MSDEIKRTGEQEERKAFTVKIDDESFTESIPVPESTEGKKPHKVVRFVDNTPREEAPAKKAKKKGGFMGEFIAGAAAGAKSVGEGISAGIKTVSEKNASEEKNVPVKKEDEVSFPKDDKKAKAPRAPKTSGGIMDKFNKLPTKAVIGGAAGILVVLIAIILILATSCSAQGNEPSEPANPGSDIVIGPEEPQGPEEPEGPVVLEMPERKDLFAEAFNANNDVVGWLYIPGLEDVDAGVCFSYDKSYPYDKRDITGKKVPNSYWIDGAYYTHYRGLFGDTVDDLSPNTVIFGHSDLGLTNLAYKDDDPTGPLFSQLFNFKDPSFAEKTPYIYLTLPGEDTVWEIFSVFYNDAKAENSKFAKYYSGGNGGSLWYIEPNPAPDEYQLMIDTIRERSLYDYNIEVTTGDRILTLSTCTVGYGLNSRSNYRFVVVAKLVENPEVDHIQKNASFTINADAPIPSSYKSEFDGYVANWKPSEE